MESYAKSKQKENVVFMWHANLYSFLKTHGLCSRECNSKPWFKIEKLREYVYILTISSGDFLFLCNLLFFNCLQFYA